LTFGRTAATVRAVPTVVFGDFEWDRHGAVINFRTHRVTFEEAVSALADPLALEAPDLLGPSRHVTIGRSALVRTMFVVHTEVLARGRTRIVSARLASAAQRRMYEEGSRHETARR
jgi:uncharacterized DUF497 family protein